MISLSPVQDVESKNQSHIFYSHVLMRKKIWSLIPIIDAVQLAVVPDFKSHVIEFRRKPCLPPSGISINILPWVCWQIWTSQNHLIFEIWSFPKCRFGCRFLLELQPGPHNGPCNGLSHFFYFLMQLSVVKKRKMRMNLG